MGAGSSSPGAEGAAASAEARGGTVEIRHGCAYKDGKWTDSRVEIGKGAFAVVKLARKKDQPPVAVKRIDKQKLSFSEQQHVRDEVSVMNKLAEAGWVGIFRVSRLLWRSTCMRRRRRRRCTLSLPTPFPHPFSIPFPTQSHPSLLSLQLPSPSGHSLCKHIVKLLEVYESTRYLDLVLEYVNRGQVLETLVYRTKSYTEFEASRCVRQVALALKHMHAKSIGHFDIKPANLVLSSSSSDSAAELPILKLVDFGLAQACDPKTGFVLPPARGAVGTVSYVAPEVLSGSGKYGTPADIWSLGVLLFLLLSGSFPHHDEDEKKYLTKIMTTAPTWPDPITWSAEAKDLAEKMLVMEPEGRIDVDAVLEVSGKIPRSLVLRHNLRLLLYSTHFYLQHPFCGPDTDRPALPGGIPLRLRQLLAPSRRRDLDRRFPEMYRKKT